MINDDIITIRNSPEIYFASVAPDKSVQIKWDKAQGAQRYIVRRKREEESTFVVIAKLDSSELSYTDKKIESEGIYVYRVTAERSVPNEKPIKKVSETKSINITSIEAPVIKDVRSDYEKDGIAVSFSGISGVDGYNIIKRYPAMSRGIRTGAVSNDQSQYLDKKIQKGVLYYYSVEAFKRSGAKGDEITYSNPSDEICSVLLDRVKVMKIKRKLYKNVNISVRLTSGADGYILYKSDKENGTYKEIARTKSISDLTLSAKGEKKEKGAYFKVACYKKSDGSTEFTGPCGDAFYVKYI